MFNINNTNGAFMAIDQLKRINTDLKSCRNRIEEINHRDENNQMNIQTCEELKEQMDTLKTMVEQLYMAVIPILTTDETTIESDENADASDDTISSEEYEENIEITADSTAETENENTVATATDAAISEETFNEIKKAKSVLCDYCDDNECDNCKVAKLMDDATLEAIEAGIISDY